jgi:uncharacterized protein YndB with AHSA1/START domain
MLARNDAETSIALPSDTDIAITRLFSCPAHLLFDAWTKPEHLKNWWGCENSTMTVCEIDLREGGNWRYTFRMADGIDHPFSGTYREIVPGRRLVYSERYEMPMFGNPEWLTTVTFDEANGKTLLTHLIQHKSKVARDGHLQAGMKEGATQTMDRLEQEVAAMATDAVPAH